MLFHLELLLIPKNLKNKLDAVKSFIDMNYGPATEDLVGTLTISGNDWFIIHCHIDHAYWSYIH